LPEAILEHPQSRNGGTEPTTRKNGVASVWRNDLGKALRIRTIYENISREAR
jgi:hypothetical protein